MDLNVFRVCSEEFTKLSALSDEEKEFFRKVINLQSAFDTAAGKGGMSAADQAAHRDNTQRMQHFLNKKKNDDYRIPDWVKDLKSKPPAGAPAAPGPGSYNAPNPGGYDAPRSGGGSSDWDDFMRNAWGGHGEGGWRERAAEHEARRAQWAEDHQKSRRTGGSILGGMLGAPIGLIAGDMASTHLRRKAREKGEKSEAAKYLPLIGAVGGGALGAYAGYKFSSVDLSQVFLSRPK